jgi:hypothetical protein
LLEPNWVGVFIELVDFEVIELACDNTGVPNVDKELELILYVAIDVRWVVLYGRDGNVKLTLCKVCKFVIILAVVSANDNKYPTKLI